MILRFFRSKFYTALALMIFVFSFGVLGYKFYANYTWIDAVYMTIITVATVGFREINPTDDGTKIFTIILIILSIFIFAYSITVITEYILAKNTFEELKIKKMKKKIRQLQGHIVLCGYGRNGKQAASKLSAHKRPFVVIEKDTAKIPSDDENIFIIEGSATDDHALVEAGIANAGYLITTLPNDADNLFVVLSSRQLNKNLTIISRASKTSSQKKLLLAGADKIIMPDKIGGEHMASLIVFPEIMAFMDQVSVEGDNTSNLEEISIEELPEKYNSKSIAELDLRKKTGCTVIGYKNPEGIYIVNPEAHTKMVPGSKIIVLGQPRQIKKLNAIFKS